MGRGMGGRIGGICVSLGRGGVREGKGGRAEVIYGYIHGPYKVIQDKYNNTCIYTHSTRGAAQRGGVTICYAMLCYDINIYAYTRAAPSGKKMTGRPLTRLLILTP